MGVLIIGFIAQDALSSGVTKISNWHCFLPCLFQVFLPGTPICLYTIQIFSQ